MGGLVCGAVEVEEIAGAASGTCVVGRMTTGDGVGEPGSDGWKGNSQVKWGEVDKNPATPTRDTNRHNNMAPSRTMTTITQAIQLFFDMTFPRGCSITPEL